MQAVAFPIFFKNRFIFTSRNDYENTQDFIKIEFNKPPIRDWFNWAKANFIHPLVLELVEHQDELDKLRRMARQGNDILKPYFAEKGLNLVDFKLEFGKDSNGNIILVDEISPDNCRFWDIESGEKMDKDRFRQGLGGLTVAYEQVLNRILGK